MNPECYARDLLDELGLAAVALPAPPRARGVADRWAASGLVWLTGPAGGTAIVPRAALPEAADGCIEALRATAPGATALADIDGAGLLGERAACAGLSRRGRQSPGGAARLYAACGGWLVLNLARGAEDERLLPAWLEDPEAASDVPALGAAVAGRDRDALVERGRLLGLAVAAVDPVPPQSVPWLVRDRVGTPGPGAAARFRVLDLSGLWAGPLCAQLLRLAGATVWKLESEERPDGARRGPAAFFDRLNAGKASVALPFRTASGRRHLVDLLDAVDVVIEASRPRALAQLGVDAKGWVRGAPGRTWLSITGWGRPDPRGQWVAFGDDAALAAGLGFRVGPDAPLFVGDAVADPIAAVHAAVAVQAARRSGGGELLDLSMVGCMNRVLAWPQRAADFPLVETRAGEPGLRDHAGDWAPLRPPRCPRSDTTRPARELGADTDAVLRQARETAGLR